MKEENKNKDIDQTIPEVAVCKTRKSQPYEKVAETPDKNSRGWFMAETLESCGGQLREGKVYGIRAWCNRGFTLIELLVVVLIIGILAAIAVPQYQKAAEKARAPQAITLLKTLGQALEQYHMANGDSCPSSFDELGVSAPGWTATDKWLNITETPTLSNNTWSLQLHCQDEAGEYLSVAHISGPYAGAGFYYPFRSSIAAPYITYCVERRTSGVIFNGKKGDYCQKIMNGTYMGSPYNAVYIFRLP